MTGWALTTEGEKAQAATKRSGVGRKLRLGPSTGSDFDVRGEKVRVA
jgi:hypothetical protein